MLFTEVFDYAEKVRIPNFLNQPKQLYFKSGLKVDLFGIANNTSGFQHNFVLPEGHWPADKSINSVASMIWYYIRTYQNDKRIIHLMADNCTGQNKNRYMLWFLHYLLIISEDKIDSIHLMFLIAGHTKNFCDACFGLCKRSLKSKDILTPTDVVNAYSNSAKCNFVQTTTGIIWYDWKSFLKQFFKGKVKNILKQQHFYFNKANLDSMQYKALATTTEFSTLEPFKKDVTINNIKNPTGVHQSLEEFIIEENTYSFNSNNSNNNDNNDNDTDDDDDDDNNNNNNDDDDNVIEGNKTINRKQYLENQLVKPYFIGEHAAKKLLYFGNGSDQL